MANIAFLQTLVTENLAVMLLSAVLKKRGHRCKVFMYELEKNNFIDKIKEFNPHLIAFSCMHHTYAEDIKIAQAVKQELKTLIIFGGICPTLSPKIINHPSIDIICRGEGESAILELAEAVENKKDYTRIKNLWVKKDNEVFENGQRPLVESLEGLPYPDRGIYYEQSKFLRNFPTKKFVSGRGCPYSCAFCCTPAQREISGEGRFVRRQGVEKLIEEIKIVKDKYFLRSVSFADDLFTVDKKWVSTFLERYRKDINLPFSCNIRPDTIDEDIVELLAGSRCKIALFGIETGSQAKRADILRKTVTNGQIIKTAELLKKYKIRFVANNILGYPGETFKDAWETLELNTAIKADYPWVYFFMPYPQSALGEKYFSKYENGCLDWMYPRTSTLTHCIANLKDSYKVVNLQRLFYWGVKFPCLQVFVKRLIKLPPNMFFDFLYLISYAYCFMRAFMINLYWVFRFGFNYIKLLKE